MKKQALIIGAGPAGLTAAYELLRRTDSVHPVVIEAEPQPGGISRTLNFNGFRLDIGGHRFFSKSDEIMKWWFDMLPPSGTPSRQDPEIGTDLPFFPNGPDPLTEDDVFLIRKRLSRILFERKFYPYPIDLSTQTVKNLGIYRTLKIGLDYLLAAAFPLKPERNLEEFLINRFGKSLYRLFFKDYTAKVWGRQCNEIEASWGAQRIKGLSIKKVLLNAINLNRDSKQISQKDLETSLINYFLYPKYGPGQLWEKVSREVVKRGGEISFSKKVVSLFCEGSNLKGALIEDTGTGATTRIPIDYCISTAPISELVSGMDASLPEKARAIASALPYRDFITVGICLDDANLPNLRDNWIYIQERDVKLGRIQLFRNWSPFLVPRSDVIWLGLEYFANEGDELWSRNSNRMKALAVEELSRLGIIKDPACVNFAKTVKVKKAYPAYWGSYTDFHQLRGYLDRIENLFLVGRNGMHRYNNQDHSMLSAMEAVKNIVEGVTEKDNIWNVNAEEAYHEKGNLQ